MSALVEKIKAEIAVQGAIPFARFMELALYCPEYGYYERESVTVGRHGDFYTSVSVGSLFGELLAFQFAEWLEKIPGDKVQIVEAGAHDGKLALDILRWLKRFRPELFARLNYCILDPSTQRQAWQQKTLAEFGVAVIWLEMDALDSKRAVQGVIFANELLDAMPVHRLGWDAKKREWFEWGVTVNAERFDWAKMRPSVELKKLGSLPNGLLEVLPDDFTTEICPVAEDWWSSAAQSLKAGTLMTLDYGTHNEAGLSPNHPNGNVRAYHRHKLCDNILANPGEQDITANVDFHGIQQAGEAMGLRTEAFISQSQFLTGIASRFVSSGVNTGEWSPKKNRELQTLIHPEHLGRAFRVLVQSR
jgi:SAM-dependent MidA family methyltransferase